MISRERLLSCGPLTVIDFRGRARVVVKVGVRSVFFYPLRCSWTSRCHAGYGHREVMREGTVLGRLREWPSDEVRAASIEMDRLSECTEYLVTCRGGLTARGRELLKEVPDGA